MCVSLTRYFNLFDLVSRPVPHGEVARKSGNGKAVKKKDGLHVWKNVTRQEWIYLWERWTLGDRRVRVYGVSLKKKKCARSIFRVCVNHRVVTRV